MRERVLQAVDKGYPRTEIIKLFGVSRATIKRYLKQRCETSDGEQEQGLGVSTTTMGRASRRVG